MGRWLVDARLPEQVKPTVTKQEMSQQDPAQFSRAGSCFLLMSRWNSVRSPIQAFILLCRDITADVWISGNFVITGNTRKFILDSHDNNV